MKLIKLYCGDVCEWAAFDAKKVTGMDIKAHVISRFGMAANADIDVKEKGAVVRNATVIHEIADIMFPNAVRIDFQDPTADELKNFWHCFPYTHTYSQVRTYLARYILLCDAESVALKCGGNYVRNTDQIRGHTGTITIEVRRDGMLIQPFALCHSNGTMMYSLYIKPGASFGEICKVFGNALSIQPFQVKLEKDGACWYGVFNKAESYIIVKALPNRVFLKAGNLRSGADIALSFVHEQHSPNISVAKRALLARNAAWGTGELLRFTYNEKPIQNFENLVWCETSRNNPIKIHNMKPYEFKIGDDMNEFLFAPSDKMSFVLRQLRDFYKTEGKELKTILRQKENKISEIKPDKPISRVHTHGAELVLVFTDIIIPSLIDPTGKNIKLMSRATSCRAVKESIALTIPEFSGMSLDQIIVATDKYIIAPNQMVNRIPCMYFFAKDHKVVCHLRSPREEECGDISVEASKTVGDLMRDLLTRYRRQYGVYLDDHLLPNDHLLCHYLFKKPDLTFSLYAPIGLYTVVFGQNRWRCTFEMSALTTVADFLRRIKILFTADDKSRWNLCIGSVNLEREEYKKKMLMELERDGLLKDVFVIRNATTAEFALSIRDFDSETMIPMLIFSVEATVQDVIDKLAEERSSPEECSFWRRNKEIWGGEDARNHRVLDYVVPDDFEQIHIKPLAEGSGAPDDLPVPVRSSRKYCEGDDVAEYEFVIADGVKITIMLDKNCRASDAIRAVVEEARLSESKNYVLSHEGEKIMDGNQVLSDTTVFVHEAVYIAIDDQVIPVLEEWSAEVAKARYGDSNWSYENGLVIENDVPVRELVGVQLFTVPRNGVRTIEVTNGDKKEVYKVNGNCSVKSFVDYLVKQNFWSLDGNIVCDDSTIFDSTEGVRLKDVNGALRVQTRRMSVIFGKVGGRVYLFKHGDEEMEIELGQEETILTAKGHIITLKEERHHKTVFTDDIQINFRGRVLLNGAIPSTLDVKSDEFFQVFIDDHSSPWLRSDGTGRDDVGVVDISKWEYQGFLGRGAYGEVVLYKDPTTDELWAVKSMEITDKTVRLFHQEFNALKKLLHPCVLNVRGRTALPEGCPNTVLSIITEYMPNRSLKEVLEQVRNGGTPDCWTPTNRAIMIVGLVCGMKYVHAQGTLHLDLKPGNLLLDENYRIRIGDFGSCRTQDISGTLTVGGTPLYLAPELSEDLEEYDGSIDVYSAALIIYETITGEEILKEGVYKNGWQVIRKMSNGYRPEFPADVKAWVKKLVTRCWSKKPSERMTFEEICRELEANDFQILDGVDSEAVRTLYQAWK